MAVLLDETGPGNSGLLCCWALFCRKSYSMAEVQQAPRSAGAKIMDKFNGTAETANLMPQNRGSAIQLEREQGSIIN
jgi:hypothetical protein